MAPQLVQKVAHKASSRAWDALTPELSLWILSAVSSMGFHRMTPVQASCIPLFMAHKDVVVEAVTGSGKTLAFLVPIVEKILRLEERPKRHHIASIIISPTTELARQIHTVLSTLLAFHPPSLASRPGKINDSSDEEGREGDADIYTSKTPIVLPQLLVAGGVSPSQDLKWFIEHSPNLLIATPGRLLELLKSPHVQCPQSSFEVLVLDEADRLLDLGFKDDLQKILGRLPKQRRTGLFSATVGEAVDQIVRVGLRNPVKITVKVKGLDGKDDRRTPASLQMCCMLKPASQKWPAVCQLLSTLQPYPYKTIIYLSTCAAVHYFQHLLPRILPRRDGQTFSLVPLHGKQQQKIREKHFRDFSNSTTPTILLTTDVAARGLDIPQVDLVLQIDPPNDPRVFLHRCGRAGRAGRKGLSILFLQPGREEDYLPFLEIRKTPLTAFSQADISADDAQAIEQKMRRVALTDRSLHDKGQRAFVSWAKAYSKHQASSIFRLEDQNWDDLGHAWVLLKLPKMPELKGFEGDKSLGVALDWRSYAYRDKVKEQNRLKALTEESGEGDTAPVLPKIGKKRAWSQKLDQHDEREIRRTKKQRRREREKWEQMTAAEREKQQELESMIEQVKRKTLSDEKYDDFEGFD